jgi:hypothetical protein
MSCHCWDAAAYQGAGEEKEWEGGDVWPPIPVGFYLRKLSIHTHFPRCTDSSGSDISFPSRLHLGLGFAVVCSLVRHRWIIRVALRPGDGMSAGTQGYSDLMADPKERFDIVNGKQIALLVAPVLCFVLASIAVAARWYTRSVRRVNTLWEDGLCLAALVCWYRAQRLRTTNTSRL